MHVAKPRPGRTTWAARAVRNKSKVISGDAIAADERGSLPEVASDAQESSSASGQQRYLRADHLEKIQRQAYDEAYAQGYKEGVAAGQSQDNSQAQRLTQLSAKLSHLLGEFVF